MASAIEQLSRNTNWASLAKASELKKRIGFVLLALIIYRLGTFIPVPGVDPEIWREIYQQRGGGILDMFNMFSGGALARMTIFALNIVPYISSSIIMQLASAMSPKLEALKKDGEAGRMKINQYTRYLTVILASIQAYGMAVGLESIHGSSGISAVIDPGLFFRVSTVITIVGGTVFLMWLGEQITARGVGNGTSLIIFSGIVAGLPTGIVTLLELGRQGNYNFLQIAFLFALICGLVAFIVFCERAQRRITVQYPKRQAGGRVMASDSNHIPLKINTAGVIPPIFASSLLILPLSVVKFLGAEKSPFLNDLSRWLGHGEPLFMVLYGALIIFFAFFYTAIVFNPQENADMLKKNGGFIPGIRPGKSTADYFDYVLTRITVLGAAYITIVCLIPEILVKGYALPFYIGGTSVLIAVTVTMETVAQIHSHLIAHQYESLIRRAKLKGKRR